MTEQPLFLLGSGRSGTTLIQRFLNAHPEVMIWGEHAGFLEKIAEVYFDLKSNSSLKPYSYDQSSPSEDDDPLTFYKDPTRWQAWINWWKEDDIDEMFKNFMRHFFNSEQVGTQRIWGFKEIRYGKNQIVIKFLKALYPNAVFLVFVREGLNVIESQLDTFHQGSSKHKKLKRILQIPLILKITWEWKKMNQNFFNLSKDLPNFYFIKYEEFLNDFSVLDETLDDLKLEITDEQRKVLQLKSGRGSNKSVDTDVNLRWTSMGLLPALIIEVMIGNLSEQINYERPKSLLLATKFSKFIFK